MTTSGPDLPYRLFIPFLVFAGLRVHFLIVDVHYWFDVTIRNRTAHRVVTSGFSLPLEQNQESAIDTSGYLTIDGSQHPIGAVKGVVITGIAFVPGHKSGPYMVGAGKMYTLSDKISELPFPWTPQLSSVNRGQKDCLPVFSPTLIFEDSAYQLFDTKDLSEARMFTRLLRQAFGFKGYPTLFGVLPFQIRQNISFEMIVYPLIGMCALPVTLIVSMVAAQKMDVGLTLLTALGFYSIQEGLMLLCSRSKSLLNKATRESQRNVAWLVSRCNG